MNRSITLQAVSCPADTGGLGVFPLSESQRSLTRYFSDWVISLLCPLSRGISVDNQPLLNNQKQTPANRTVSTVSSVTDQCKRHLEQQK